MMTDVVILESPSTLRFHGRKYRCCIGPNGVTMSPREGGKATPEGIFALRQCLYRPDRLVAPETRLPVSAIRTEDGWCDDPTDKYYNRLIKLPFSGTHEILWREDGVYDIVVPLGFNDDPVIPGKGSAIFFHLAHDDYRPTLGCVAVSLPDMLAILRETTAETCMRIPSSLAR